MEVEADAVAHTARDNLHAAAVEVVAADLAMYARVDLAHVAGRADLEIDFFVGSVGEKFPVVVHVRRQLEVVGHLHRRRQVVEVGLDVVVAEHAVDGCHVERVAQHQHAIGLVELLGDDLRGALAVFIHDRIDATDGAGADEHRAVGRPRHHSRAGDAVRPDLDLEAGGYLNFVERDLFERGDGEFWRIAGEVGVLHALGIVAAHGAPAFGFCRRWRCGVGALLRERGRC